jgi:hypothetical protein
MRILSYKSVNVKLSLEGLPAKKAKILGSSGSRPNAHAFFATGGRPKNGRIAYRLGLYGSLRRAPPPPPRRVLANAAADMLPR